MMESGISAYFKDGKIRIRFKTIEDLGFPEDIHLRINEEKKQLFIEKCVRDIDSFHVEYQKRSDGTKTENDGRNIHNEMNGRKVKGQSCYIHSIAFLRYMAHVIGVPVDSPSLRFKGEILPDGTMFIDLSHYTVIQQRRDGRYSGKKR